ncbi:MAG: 4Fe-4S ferredoxin [Firmicutes bacterium]|nr:4Fe-4S ferredoxin [Bacillota bacterium]
MRRKSHMNWSWIFMVIFLTLGILDIRFGILGFICMGAPIYHAVRGEGKVHCAKYCPRGSILAKFLQNVSLDKNMPKFLKKKIFKNLLLGLMITVFSISLFHAGLNFTKIAFSIFRFMTMSLAIGVIMGIIFKPRSWCMVCPMGHATGLIKKSKDDKKASKSNKRKQTKVA